MPPIKNLRERTRRIKGFVTALLDADLAELPRGRRAIAYPAKMLREIRRQTAANNFMLRANALAFRTLLALAPFLVVLLGVSAGMLSETRRNELVGQLFDKLVPMQTAEEEAAGPVSHRADRTAEMRAEMKEKFIAYVKPLRTYARQVNTIGIALLLWTVISLMFSVESTMNAIWHVRRGRRWIDKLPYYVAVVMLCVAFLLISAGLEGMEIVQKAQEYESLRGAAGFAARFAAPWACQFLALTVLFIWMPSAEVKWRSAAAGAAVAATGFTLCQEAFAWGVVSVVGKHMLYGSLAILPILFVWLYVSWIVVLFGAEVAFVAQNFRDLAERTDGDRRGFEHRLYCALRLTIDVCRRFDRGESPRVVRDGEAALGIPEYAVRGILDDLAERGVLRGVAGDPDAYVPGKTLRTLTAADALAAAGAARLEIPSGRSGAEHDLVGRVFEKLRGAQTEGAGKMTMAEMLEELGKATGGEREAAKEEKKE
jgi:membrane protein